MNLLARILALVACVVVVYALPQIEPRSLGPMGIYKEQAKCNRQFEERQQYINDQINIQTAKCIWSGNNTVNQTEEQTKDQVAMARGNLTLLQANLNNCSALSDDWSFVNCNNNKYSENQYLLNNAHSLTTTVAGESESTIDCIANVWDEGSKNMTAARKEYNKCLDQIFKPSN